MIRCFSNFWASLALETLETQPARLLSVSASPTPYREWRRRRETLGVFGGGVW